ncbi:NRPS [Arachnomyces sp. PD_36]|nr:NRPS [Arachnomyces sp. PD_36]
MTIPHGTANNHTLPPPDSPFHNGAVKGSTPGLSTSTLNGATDGATNGAANVIITGSTNDTKNDLSGANDTNGTNGTNGVNGVNGANGANGNENGVNGTANGAANGESTAKGSSAQLPESIESWVTRIDGLDGRCDLSGLARDATKYQIAFNDDEYMIQDRRERTLVIGDKFYPLLKASCKRHNMSVQCAILFSVHKMLLVFGNGNDTVVAAVGSMNNDDCSSHRPAHLTPTTVDHQQQQTLSCIEAVQNVEAAMVPVIGHLDLNKTKKARLFDCVCSFTDPEEDTAQWQTPISVIVRESENSLVLTMRFPGEMFAPAAIDGFLSVIDTLLHQIAENPVQVIEELDYLSLSQKQQLEQWNHTDGDYPSSKRLNQLVEEAVERTPDKVAVVYRDLKLTYRELNQSANRLAHHLVNSVGVHPEQFIGLFLDKSQLMIITILGIWKAGATYTPIDPAYPDERVRFALEDTQAKIVIANQCHTSRLVDEIVPNSGLSVVEIEPLLESLDADPSTPFENLTLPFNSHQLAYVTYTSGTTGIPKGIFKEHHSVVNSITDLAERYEVQDKREAILLFSAYVFEPFVRQTLMALINSQLLAIIDDNEKLDLQKLPAFVERHGITYINGTASVLQEFDFSNCPTLQRMILVGEDLTETRYMELRRRFRHRIINEYGFTESAFVTALKIFNPDSERKDRSLGRPLRNVKCYVLNKNLKQTPIGATGELHIGGIGVSRGYMNREKLTRERFIPNPFQTEKEKQQGINSQMYKTGDLARWLPNGEVEYLGRNDFQVKLRGIRIEPGEIEAVLSLFPGIRTSVVVAKNIRNGEVRTEDKHLIGYFVTDEGQQIPEADVLTYLETKLPRYMIPTRLVQLPKIPVTVNGKVDLRALPDVDLSDKGVDVQVEIRNDLDRKLTEIWGEVLRIPSEHICLEDNFFWLGGHSITCIQLIARIRYAMHLDVTVEDVFSTKTLRKLSDAVWHKQQILSESAPKTDLSLDRSTPSIAGVKSKQNVENAYLANSLQQGFVYHYLKQGDIDDAYVMQSTYHYATGIDAELLRGAWKYAQLKYSSLRIRFTWKEDVLQIIDKEQSLDWRFIDLSGEHDSSLHSSKLREIQDQDRVERYRLEIGNLFRVYLVKMSEDNFVSMLSCHHTIMDGWSLPLLFEYVHHTYLQLLEGQPVALTPDTAYSDAQDYLQQHRTDHIDYWAQQMGKVVERCDLNSLLNEESRYKVPLADYDRVTDQKEKTITIGDAWTPVLTETCSANGITLHSILQFAWHAVLRAYGGGTQTVTGTTISGRNLPVDDIEKSVGLFINTLPLIVDHQEQSGKNVIDAVIDVQAQSNAMNSRSNVELGHLIEGGMKHGIFDTLFVLENYPNLDKSQAELQKQKLQYVVQSGLEKLDYPLAVIARESETLNEFTVTICYAGELFDDSTISELLEMVEALFRQVAENPEQSVADLEYLSPSQLQQLAAWNANEDDFPLTTLHHVFEMEAERVPEKVAVIYEDVKLTYRELNERANQMAHFIRSSVTIKPDDLIALFTEKSEHLFISILGVWKSGAAYVPIDPSYPDDRIQYILKDTKAKLVIADPTYVTRLKAITMSDVVDTGVASRPGSDFSSSNPHPISGTNDLAYVIYTSGTTGNPKGVMVEHRGVVNLKVSLAKIFSLNDTDDEVILSFSNYVFDHFIEQMTDALLNGQTLLVLNDAMRADKERLYKYMADNKVTYLSGTPSVISVYEYDRFLSHLRRVDCVGEAFSEPVFNKIRDTFPGLVINGYGPTEVSITSNKRPYPPDQWRKDKSIGKQVANTTSYVLDDNMRRVPIGAVGELYLGGTGVARGYHNRPDLTADRFPPNPFQTAAEKEANLNDRLYKTGDLVRWLPNSDGEIEYLGRNDFQVKIRGLRIELGEIEAVLSSYPGIKQSVVVAKDQQIKDANGADTVQKYLVGYYVCDTALTQRDIKKFMQSKLPEYMIPNRLVPIEKIPVTISGKLDTKSLPATEFASGDEYRAPRTEVELILCNIWSELLGIPSEYVGISDDFFSLGGDSLMSTKLSFMITKAFGRTVSVAALFKHKTIEALSHYVLSESDESEDIQPLENPSQGVAVSLSQERVLFIDEFEGGTDAYNIALNFQLPKTVNRSYLKEALQSVVSRHKALRTLLPKKDQGGVRRQRVLNEDESLAMLSMEEMTVADTKELEDIMTSRLKYIFRLDQELPVRVGLYEVSSNGDAFFMSIILHHTCFDAWSWGILSRDLKAFYGVLDGTSSNANLPPLQLQYPEYANWQRRYLNQSRLQSLSEFWGRKLDGFEQLHLIPDSPRPTHFDYIGNDVQFNIGLETTNDLRRLARELKVSLHSLLMTGYYMMLSSFTNQKDIVIGSPIANRNRPELENVIGFFVNMLVLRLDLTSKNSIADGILAVNGELIQAQLHQEMPFQEVVKTLGVENDPSRHPIVQAIFSLDPFDKSADTSSGLVMSEYQPTTVDYSSAKFDLAATMTESPTGLKGNFNYAKSLFHEKTIRGFTHTYKHILEQLSQLSVSEASKVSNPSMADGNSHAGLLSGKQIASSHSEDESKTLHELFEDQVVKSGGEVAVVSGTTSLTYQQLNERANQLAHYLQSVSSIKPDDMVALLLDKSEFMIISILAVWKAGAGYIPLDPRYPVDRVGFILKDTMAKVAISNSHYSSMLNGTGAEVPVVEVDSPSTTGILDRQPNNNPKSDTCGSSLAYAIYTSGTTGTPKCVLVQHRGIVNLRNSLRDLYFGSRLEEQQGILLLSNYVFDFSVEQLVLSILSSNKLIIPCNEFAIDDGFYEYLNSNGLTYLSGTPTFLDQFDMSRLSHLHTLTAAGEEFHASQFTKIRQAFKGTVNNAYGVTETTVYNMVNTFKGDDGFENSMGELLPNMKGYILNDRLQLLPPGAVGELHLSGDCLARGYLNRPEITNQRFLDNPFRSDEEICSGSHTRIYKTGDLVRYQWDGKLEFLGRNDFQVKINGFRVELSEIRSVLASHPSVKECVVLAKYNKDLPHSRQAKQLIGYYVSEDLRLQRTDLATFLQKKLPYYMVPARFVRVEGKLPMTINGKLDTRALPDVDLNQEKAAYAVPRNVLEKQICQLWSSVLGIEDVGIDDDFFHLGGDSILSLQLVSQSRNELGLKVTVKDIFDFKTIRGICDNVSVGGDGQNAIEFRSEQGQLTGELPMLPIQDWFFAKNLKNPHHWNQSFFIKTPELDTERLTRAIDSLYNHHDAFRLQFRNTGGKYVQSYGPESAERKPKLNILDIRNLETSFSHALGQWQSGLNLEDGPMFAVAYVHGYEDGSARVWLAIHHLIVDTVSWCFLIRDLETLYNGKDLGQKQTSYRQWSQAVQDYSFAEGERSYWETLRDEVAVRNDNMPSPVASSIQSSWSLTTEQTKSILRDCNRAYNTRINELLLVALGSALQEVTQSETNYVTLEGHGREDIDPSLNISNTLGWFTTMYPFKVSASDDLAERITSTKERFRKVPNNGIGYGPLFGYAEGKLPRVSFNYLGQFDQGAARTGRWSMDGEMGDYSVSKSPDEVDTGDSLLDVTGICLGSQMVFHIDSRLDPIETEIFSTAFKTKLEQVIEHTLESTHSRPTPNMNKTINGTEDDFIPYFEFRNGSRRGPILFVLPPGEGGAESYFNNIVRHLPHSNLVVFNNYYRHTSRLQTFEELGTFYLQYIRQIQPHGPYHFLGWSFGGLLSLEISRQLSIQENPEKVGSLMFIDSYFDVKGATCAIGFEGEEDIIEPIHYRYTPSTTDLASVVGNTSSIVLFRAQKMNDIYRSEHQRILYDYYMKSEYNSLDRLVGREAIKLVTLLGDTHFSWVKNEEQIVKICEQVVSYLGLS